MEHHIPFRRSDGSGNNPAIEAALKSQTMRRLMQEKAEEAQAIYREIVAKRSGRLASSARVETFISGRDNDRWYARMIVDAPYAASHEFGWDDGDLNVGAAAHDLNTVLNLLGTLE